MVSIESVAAEPFKIKFKQPYKNARLQFDSLTYIWAEIVADSKVGRGEVTAMPGYSSETAASIVEAIDCHFGPALTGVPLFSANEIDAAIDAALPGNAYARAAIDLALTDLRAQHLEVPAHYLFGGSLHESVDIAGIVSLAPPKEMAKQAETWATMGSRALQVKVSDSTTQCKAILDDIRSAVGAEVRIGIDGNGGFSRLESLRVMDCAAARGVEFFEQPVVADDIEGMALLMRQGSLPIIADESVLTSRQAYRIATLGAAAGFNLKLAKSGIRETLKIICIGEAAGMGFTFGGMLETGLGTLASVQFASSIKNLIFPAELIGPFKIIDETSNIFPTLAQDKLAWKVPEGIGWGLPPSGRDFGQLVA